MSVSQVPLAKLHLSQLVRRPTDEAIQRMAGSLASIGQLTPIGVAPDGKVIFGVTRCLAAKKLGWKEILARTFPEDLEPGQSFRMAVSENTVRSQMSFVEMADAIQQYAQLTGKTLQQAGQELGYKQPQISKCLNTDERLMPANKKRLIEAGIGGSLAYLYSQETDPNAQTALIERGLAEKWTRKDLEKHFRQQRAGLVRLDYQNADGKAYAEFPNDAPPERAARFLKAFYTDIHTHLKSGLTFPTIARILRENSTTSGASASVARESSLARPVPVKSS